MKTTLFVLVFITSFGFALPADALDIQAITSKPSADNPQFDNKEAWPDLVGDEYFQKEKWPKARLLIWAPPRVDEARGKRFSKPIDQSDPANWIDAATGKPADAMPDMDTDIILPDADKPYKVSFKGQTNRACRHLTVGRNADFQPGGGGSIAVFGNVWIRPGGILYVYRTLKLAGGGNTFFRNDWPADGTLKKIHDTGAVVSFDPANPREPNPWSWRTDRHPSVCHFFQHDKPEGTTEFIGYSSTRDEARVMAGTLIVGRDSRFVSMGPSSVTVNKGARVVLMDGAMCSHGKNQFVSRDWNIADGAEVTGGTPDRPLRRDAYFGLGYRNWMNLPVPPARESQKIKTLPSGTEIHYGYDGYNALIAGDLIGYPAPESNARLVVCWQRLSVGGAGNWGRVDEAFTKVFPKIVPKIGLWISGTSKLDNVRFDDLRRGGIVTANMDAFKNWKNISFGDGCLSKDPSELVRGYEAEIAKMKKKVHPMSVLEPEKKYTTP